MIDVAVEIQGQAAELIEVDAAFSRMSVAEGMPAAFLAYAAPDAVMLSQSGVAIKGWESLRDLLSGRPGGATTLVWTPLYADIAESGELGYTYGASHLSGTGPNGEPIEARGHYVSVWKRQLDGSWKWVLDSGAMQPVTTGSTDNDGS
jgi:ketosteroid isomerase-like protein